MNKTIIELLLIIIGFMLGTMRRRILVDKALKKLDPNEPQPIFDAKLEIIKIFNDSVFSITSTPSIASPTISTPGNVCTYCVNNCLKLSLSSQRRILIVFLVSDIYLLITKIIILNIFGKYLEQ